MQSHAPAAPETRARVFTDAELAEMVDFHAAIDPENWQTPGDYYRNIPMTTRAAVAAVVESDSRLREELRDIYLPALKRQNRILAWERASDRYIELLQQKKLYAGRVVAADGTLDRYASLSFVGAQIGLTRVSYQGDTGQVVANLMLWSRELPRETSAADIARAIRERAQISRDGLSNLLLHALMTYKEREFLLESGPDVFKLIHGPMFPYEMLTGAGRAHALTTCLKIIGKLVDDGHYAAIVSSSTDGELLDLGLALDAREYLIVQHGADILQSFLGDANFTRTPIAQYAGKSQIDVFEEFMCSYGSRVVQGVVKAHAQSRPFVFFCNSDNVDEAVHMLLADAENTGPRGFPLLIDLADRYCADSFKASEYTARVNAEFTRATGGSLMYQSERSTRD